MSGKMELIYMYIENYAGFINKQEIKFSRNFEVDFKEGRLSIQHIDSKVKNHYGENLTNITALVGKNGMGKTTILDILGMNRKDRLNNIRCIEEEIIDKYFMLYYLYSEENGEDIYGIEFLGDNVMGEIIRNCEMIEDKGYNHSKTTIGVQFYYRNGIFVDCGKHFFSKYDDGYKLSDYLVYVYLNERKHFSNRIDTKMIRINHEDDDYLGKRLYFDKADDSEKYKTINSLMTDNDYIFLNRDVKLQITDSLDEKMYNYSDNEEIERIYSLIKKALPVYTSEINIFNKVQKKRKSKLMPGKRKEKYILDFLSRYILYTFMNAVVGNIEENVKDGKITSVYKQEEDYYKQSGTLLFAEIDNAIEFVENLEIDDNSVNTFGLPTDIQNECKNMLDVIEYYNPNEKANHFDKCYIVLLKISRYVMSRVTAYHNGKNFIYESSMEKMVEYMLKLPEEYFEKKSLLIPLVGENEKDVMDFLELYREYEVIEEDYYNNIKQTFIVKFLNLSEGENSLVNIITKIQFAKVKIKEKGLIVVLLDEPDNFLHPEWARQFIYILSKTISNDIFQGYNVQVVLSTHSPYLLSDILPQDAYTLERNKTTDYCLNIKRISQRSDKFSCFGANIFDILNRGFFIDNTIGEFATQKINQIAKEIKNLSYENFEEKADQLEYYIGQIGEPVIQNILKNQFDNMRDNFKVKKNIGKKFDTILNSISNTAEKELVQKILSEIEENTDD